MKVGIIHMKESAGQDRMGGVEILGFSTVAALAVFAAIAVRLAVLADVPLSGEEARYAIGIQNSLQSGGSSAGAGVAPINYLIDSFALLIAGSSDWAARASSIGGAVLLSLIPLLFSRKLGIAGALFTTALLILSPTIGLGSLAGNSGPILIVLIGIYYWALGGDSTQKVARSIVVGLAATMVADVVLMAAAPIAVAMFAERMWKRGESAKLVGSGRSGVFGGIAVVTWLLVVTRFLTDLGGIGNFATYNANRMGLLFSVESYINMASAFRFFGALELVLLVVALLLLPALIKNGGWRRTLAWLFLGSLPAALFLGGFRTPYIAAVTLAALVVGSNLLATVATESPIRLVGMGAGAVALFLVFLVGLFPVAGGRLQAGALNQVLAGPILVVIFVVGVYAFAVTSGLLGYARAERESAMTGTVAMLGVLLLTAHSVSGISYSLDELGVKHPLFVGDSWTSKNMERAVDSIMDLAMGGQIKELRLDSGTGENPALSWYLSRLSGQLGAARNGKIVVVADKVSELGLEPRLAQMTGHSVEATEFRLLDVLLRERSDLPASESVEVVLFIQDE